MDSDAKVSSSPERSLSTVLKAGRRRSKQPDDLAVSDTISNAERGGIRSTIGQGIDKLKDRASRSTDPEARRNSQDSNTAGRKLSKLVPSASRRRQKKAVDQDNANGDESPGLFLTTTDGSLKTVDALSFEPGNHSSESLPLRSRSVASSLLTEDDTDPESATRPTLASRPSHIGYLTLSSPLIDAQAVDASESAASELPRVLPANQPSLPHPEPALVNLDPPEQRSEGTSDADLPALGSEARGRPLGDAAAGNSVISSSVKARKPVPIGKINVSPAPTQVDSSNTTETPSTLVTPPTPEQAQIPFPPSPAPRSDSTPATLPSYAHRRVKSAAAGPSKLSVANVPPLTPALEEVKTPGGSLTQPVGTAGNAPGGFFSSLFSTTQNAVTQISNTFATPSGSIKPRSGPGPREGDKVGPTGDEEVIIASGNGDAPTNAATVIQVEPAVATLGSGSLKLSHLGISEPSSDASMTSRDDLHDEVVQSPTIIQDKTVAPRGDYATPNEPIVTGFSEKPLTDGATSVAADRNSILARPKSISSTIGTLPGDATPPRSLANGPEDLPTQRSGSVRSRLSDKRKRRRNNSAYSGAPSAIAAALAASHNAIANPAAGGPRRTTYPAANQKRNKDFHQLFKSVPEDDCLLEDYSAALQREILLHGRLYISERHICFSSNIMGWITTLVVSFDEVVALEKKNTAMIFPNAIVIQTLHAKNVFASLINRDGTYDLLLGIWKIGHPNLKATEGGHALDNSAANQPARANGSMDTDDETDEDEEDDDDDADENGAGSFVDGDGSIIGSDAGEPSKVVNQRVASSAAGPGPAANGSANKAVSTSDVVSALDGFPGPATHAPTECTDQDSHYDKVCLDDTIPAPLGKVYSMLFGPLSGSVMQKFLEDQESGDIQYEDDKKGMGEAAKNYSYSFIKKLGGGIGPKQTRCIVDQTLDAFDLEKAVSVTCSTQTPDVPSGNSFVTKTKYCLMWAPNNYTRLLMSSTTEWSGKSFLRGAIDKGAESGQIKYGNDLSAFLKTQLAAKSPVKVSRAKGKTRKKKTSESASVATSTGKETAESANSKSKGSWGVFEPLRAIFSPLGDIIGPFVSTTALLYVLLITVTFLWLRQSYGLSGKHALESQGSITPNRLLRYEELWRREESELWAWLEDRIGLDGLASPAQNERKLKQAIRGRSIGAKLDAEKMNDRQIDDAIRVTEERLDALKAVIEQKKLSSKATEASS